MQVALKWMFKQPQIITIAGRIPQPSCVIYEQPVWGKEKKSMKFQQSKSGLLEIPVVVQIWPTVQDQGNTYFRYLHSVVL